MPALLLSSIFFLLPIGLAFILSFKSYSLFDGNFLTGGEFIGLKNYSEIFQDKTFLRSLVNILLFSLGVIPVQLSIALGLALIANSDIKARGFFRTAYYIPSITSIVAVSIVFMFIFKVDGLMNKVLGIFGIKAVSWFFDPRFALILLMIMTVWLGAGFYMIIFLAGLQDIPRSLYEAASIDGANRWQQFIYITIMELKPKIFFAVIMSLLATSQVFDQAFIISGGTGGPVNSTMTVVLYIYNLVFKDLRMGYASAMAFVLLCIILVITLIQKKLFNEQ